MTADPTLQTISGKKRGLQKLLKNEQQLQKKIHELLSRAIEREKKALEKARKAKERTNQELHERINQLKAKQREYQQHTAIIKSMRQRQQGLQHKISELKKFVAKHSAKSVSISKEKKPAVKKTTIKKTPLKKIIPVKKIKAKKTILSKSFEPKPKAAPKLEQQAALAKKILQTTWEKEVEKAKTPILEETPNKEVEDETEEEPQIKMETEEASKTEESEEPPRLQEEETHISRNAPTEEKSPATTTESETRVQRFAGEGQNEWVTYNQNGIRFNHPNWSSITPNKGSLFAVQKEGTTIELTIFDVDRVSGLSENVHAKLDSLPNSQVISEDPIKEYLFVTYMTMQKDAVTKHYALFAQKNNTMIRIEANGPSAKLDQQSNMVIKIFRSFGFE